MTRLVLAKLASLVMFMVPGQAWVSDAFEGLHISVSRDKNLEHFIHSAKHTPLLRHLQTYKVNVGLIKFLRDDKLAS